MTSCAWYTQLPSSSRSRFDTGSSEVAGSMPFGRSRCEQRTILAPRSRSSSIAGSAAWMRASSATSPFFSGTLKSTRTSTRSPGRVSRSRSVFLPSPTVALNAPSQQLLGQVHHAVRVTPLVVVPGADLDHGSVDHRQPRVEDRRVGRLDDVARHDGVLGVREDAL